MLLGSEITFWLSRVLCDVFVIKALACGGTKILSKEFAFRSVHLRVLIGNFENLANYNGIERYLTSYRGTRGSVSPNTSALSACFTK